MATTPMRDIIRGRPSCSLDLTIYPERAGLPTALADVVVHTASRTRLRAREKADVARELTAHFAEGIAKEKTTDDLIEAFGDVRQAARLIRRSKKRNRSRVLRAMKRATAVTFTFITILYAGVLIWYVTGSGKANPSHDYLADLNTVAAAVPEQDRAWPVYREAFISMGELPRDIRDCSGPADYRWPEVVALIESHQAELAQLRRAAAMPGLGYIVDTRFHDEDRAYLDPNGDSDSFNDDRYSDAVVPTLFAMMPQIGPMRSAARLFRFDALRRLESGSAPAAIDDIVGMIGAARHASEHQTLVSQLVRNSIITLAIETTKALLADPNGELSDHDLITLDNLFNPAIAGDLCAVSLESERLFLKDAEQYLYTDNGHSNGRLRPEMMEDVWGKPIESGTPLVLAALISAIMPDRKEFSEQIELIYATEMEDSATPMWERDVSELQLLINRVESSRWASIRWAYQLSMVPSVDRVLAQSDITAMRRDALVATIALHRYKLNNNRWPAALRDLVPGYLDAIPIDRFDGKPLRYRIDDLGEPILYSIGANFIDDAGVAGIDEDGWPTNAEAQRWRQPSEVESQKTSGHPATPADLILWPPLPDKPVEPEPEIPLW